MLHGQHLSALVFGLFGLLASSRPLFGVGPNRVYAEEKLPNTHTWSAGMGGGKKKRATARVYVVFDQKSGAFYKGSDQYDAGVLVETESWAVLMTSRYSWSRLSLSLPRWKVQVKKLPLPKPVDYGRSNSNGLLDSLRGLRSERPRPELIKVLVDETADNPTMLVKALQDPEFLPVDRSSGQVLYATGGSTWLYVRNALQGVTMGVKVKGMMGKGVIHKWWDLSTANKACDTLYARRKKLEALLLDILLHPTRPQSLRSPAPMPTPDPPTPAMPRTSWEGAWEAPGKRHSLTGSRTKGSRSRGHR